MAILIVDLPDGLCSELGLSHRHSGNIPESYETKGRNEGQETLEFSLGRVSL